jgi:hypothetical protein
LLQLRPGAFAAACPSPWTWVWFDLAFHDTVDIAKKVIESAAETVDASSGAVSQTDIMQTGGCVGDALRRQGEDAGQPKLTSKTDALLVSWSPSWGSMELKSQAEEEQTPTAAPAGSLCGSTPLTLNMGLTFHDTVDIAKNVIDCKAEAETLDTSSRAVS